MKHIHNKDTKAHILDTGEGSYISHEWNDHGDGNWHSHDKHGNAESFNSPGEAVVHHKKTTGKKIPTNHPEYKKWHAAGQESDREYHANSKLGKSEDSSDVKNIEGHKHYKKAWARNIGKEGNKRHFITTESHDGKSQVHHKDDNGIWRRYDGWGSHPASPDQKFLHNFHSKHSVDVADDAKGESTKVREGGPGYKGAAGKMNKSESKKYKITNVKVHEERNAESSVGPNFGNVEYSAHINGKPHKFYSEALHNSIINHMHNAQETKKIHPDLHNHISHQHDNEESEPINKSEDFIPEDKTIKDSTIKENYKFIVANADSVSQGIAESISNDDHESLSARSEALNGSADIIANWVSECGGTTVSRSGDEVIARVPESCLDQLEDVCSRYEDNCDHTLSIGIGDSLSQAANALAHAKEEGGDMIMDHSGGQMQDKDNDAVEDSQEEHGAIEDSDDLNEDGEITHEEATDANTEDYGDEEGSVPGEQGEPGELDHSQEDIDEDEIADYDEEHGNIDPEADDIDGDDQVTHDEAVASDAIDDIDEQSEPAPEGNIADEDMEAGEAAASEVADQEGEDMGEEYAEAAPEMDDMDEQELLDLLSQDLNEPAESGNIEEAKANLLDALQSLKENKESIEQLRQTDPDAYDRLINLIRTMIDMAKQGSDSVPEEAQEPNSVPEEMPEKEFEEMPEEAPEEPEEDPKKTRQE